VSVLGRVRQRPLEVVLGCRRWQRCGGATLSRVGGRRDAGAAFVGRSPRANVEYNYVGKQSISTTGLSPASPTELGYLSTSGRIQQEPVLGDGLKEVGIADRRDLYEIDIPAEEILERKKQAEVAASRFRGRGRVKLDQKIESTRLRSEAVADGRAEELECSHSMAAAQVDELGPLCLDKAGHCRFSLSCGGTTLSERSLDIESAGQLSMHTETGRKLKNARIRRAFQDRSALRCVQ
jgi:hypothetical protein